MTEYEQVTAIKEKLEKISKELVTTLDELQNHADKYIGKLLTVEFNGFTDDRKVPRFGRGKGFRLEEDLPR